MRILVLAAAFAAMGATLSAGGAEAGQARYYSGPWCMNMIAGDDIIEERCDMPSYEVCRREMRGLSSASCTQNPYYYAHYDPRGVPGFRWQWNRR